jgi:tRNA pseudouridine55 synthase
MMSHPKTNDEMIQGLLLVDKPSGQTSFNIVATLRKRLNVQKIGHAGTLDPFATGVLVILIGRSYTRLSDDFLTQDKEYFGKIRLGITTDTYDSEGQIIAQSDVIPSKEDIERILLQFQGDIFQTPPMFSAKKKDGQKLCDLARKGITVKREPVKISVEVKLLNYEYPYADIHVTCSKGTYIRSIAYDMGLLLDCGGHLVQLQRLRSGVFHLKDCIDGSSLSSIPKEDLIKRLRDIKNEET